MRRTGLVAIAAAAGLVVGSGATLGVVGTNGFDEPRQTGESAEMPAQPPPGLPMDELDEVVARTVSELKDAPGVHGVGRGFGTPEKDAVVIFVDNAGVGESLPQEIEGYPVVVEVVQGGFSIDW